MPGSLALLLLNSQRVFKPYKTELLLSFSLSPHMREHSASWIYSKSQTSQTKSFQDITSLQRKCEALDGKLSRNTRNKESWTATVEQGLTTTKGRITKDEAAPSIKATQERGIKNKRDCIRLAIFKVVYINLHL